jgi:serine/threonine protein kinase/Tfp pilus assembly protein PilF
MSAKEASRQRQALEVILERFEEAWHTSQPPRLEDFLGDSSVDRHQLLVELIHRDLEYRLRAGETVRVEDYLQRFPDLESTPAELMELVVAEYSLCLYLGSTPKVEDYLQRFPQCRTELANRLASSAESTDVSGVGSTADGDALPAAVGRYRVEHEIARGGMGMVVRVRDEQFQRPLAMKVLLSKGPRQADLKHRFLREARLTGQLQHPGVPPVQELGQLPDGRPYFIMKLIKGKRLADLLQERAAPSDDLPRFLGIFEQICQTLAYAHSRGIIHRDLKPANIMVGAFGEVQVMDWGLAKLLPAHRENSAPETVVEADGTIFSLPESASPDETEAGSVLGTPAYMAPEQARGQVRQLDTRCDVFGLGAVLCEILTGKPAFATGSARDNLRLAIKGDVSDALARLDQSGADAELVQLARRCLAPAPEDRPEDAAAVAAAVATYQADLQQRLKEAEIHQARVQARLLEEKKRRRLRRILVALSILVIVAASSLGAWYLGYKELLEGEMRAALNEEKMQQENLQEQLSNPTKVHVLLSQIDDWARTLDKRAEILKRARQAWANGQGLLAADLWHQFQARQAKLDADKNAFQLARELDDIRLGAVTLVEGKYNPAVAGHKYPPFFAKMNLDFQNGNLTEIAESIAESPIRYALVAALDFWADISTDETLTPRVLAVARGADPDPWRNQLRDVNTWKSLTKLQELASSINFKEQSPQIVLLLAGRLHNKGGQADPVLRQAQVHYPSDFWLHLTLARMVKDLGEQLGCFQAALAIRPQSCAVCASLGWCLSTKKDLEGTIAYYKKALDIDPNYAPAHIGLGLALHRKKDVEGAIACYKKALAIDPNDAMAHNNMGWTLYGTMDIEGAIGCYKKALDINPNYALAHNNLGLALWGKKDREGAIHHFQEAIRLDPDNPGYHTNLALIQAAKVLIGGSPKPPPKPK